jgi:hypothetical protein
MLGHLARWAGALRPLSDDTAAGDATGNAVGDGDV